MRLDPRVLSDLEVSVQPDAYIRLTPTIYRSTPMGLGYGHTRFASPSAAFQVLYIAENLLTAIAETIIRDRFEARIRRRISEAEIERWCAVEVAARVPLHLIDIRTTGLLGSVSRRMRCAQRLRVAAELLAKRSTRRRADGILYVSRLTTSRCCAIYDRGVPKLLAAGVVEVISLPDLVPCLAALNIELIR